jgi:hypothetical protein
MNVEVYVGAAPVCWCIVLVLGVIPAVIVICVSTGKGGLVALSSMLLGGTFKVLPKLIFVWVLLVDEEAAIPADPLCD